MNYFKKAKSDSKCRIVLLDGNPDVVYKPAQCKGGWKCLYPGMVDFRPNNLSFVVDGNSMIVITEFDDVKDDVPNFANNESWARNIWAGVLG